MSDTSRREVLSGAVGIAAAGTFTALPAPTRARGAERITPIQKLWQEYAAFKPHWERLCDPKLDVDGETHDAATERICDLRWAILEGPAETIADLLAQAQIAEDQDFEYGETSEALANSIRAFAQAQGVGGVHA